MKKTHEKSSIYTVTGTSKLKNPEKVVLQIEATGQRSTDGFIYLVESVAAEDYVHITAEKKLEECKKALDNMNAEKERLEELLEKAGQENTELYKVVMECRRIIGELPPEVIKIAAGNRKITE